LVFIGIGRLFDADYRPTDNRSVHRCISTFELYGWVSESVSEHS